ncbi:3-methylfumaryl-CoA hydratase [Saccharopolyspora antimicrobica]|uniref:3-methylfumaryl-CoA hydratase n=1 Tax=Saccharopolyspora antimicrobica TaxID=455193 RepID=A0A1I4QYY0_9PSEU|nr:MaoC family dehydratase N-terminal domain-containing protein [Saccharopolyspora antimicrobica]RKT88239.1 3-methylfumaryl-CoA hydratase [Saccharopolyspora antimicrobica]SFM45191.1 3-methylfumaryl-CoA hydratase [Saccharopolyspora antimicrobica]
MPGLDTYLREWRPEPLVETDALRPDPSRALAAALETAAPDDVLPPLWHWLHFLDWPRHSELGADGHPAHGHFLPPVPDRRRMFAGGRLTVTAPLRLGVPAERTTSLADVVVKQGRSGEMAFVTVRGEYRQDGELRFVDEQDYVYRSGESSAKNPDAARPTAFPVSGAPWQQAFTGDPVRLFQFSALTANTHRIHYDAPYARDVEAYPGLVVHGPLLVLLMTELARHRAPGRELAGVDYRLRRPVFAGDPVLITGGPDGDMAVRAAPDEVMATARITFG